MEKKQKKEKKLNFSDKLIPGKGKIQYLNFSRHYYYYEGNYKHLIIVISL